MKTLSGNSGRENTSKIPLTATITQTKSDKNIIRTENHKTSSIVNMNAKVMNKI